MWLTCVVLAALSVAPNQTGDLKLVNKRATLGVYGPPRASNKVLPADIFYMSFDIENLQINDKGEANYSIAVETLDSKGKVQFSNGPEDQTAFVPLGGSHLPAFAHVQIGTDTPEGTYTLHVTVVDRSIKTKEVKTELTEKFEVVKKEFGIVQPQLTYGGTPIPAPALAGVGQTLQVNCLVVNFDRDSKGNPDMLIEIKILDDANKPTMPKPLTQSLKEVAKGQTYQVIFWPLSLNRPGKFTVELQVTDQVGKKSSKVTFPLQVLEVK